MSFFPKKQSSIVKRVTLWYGFFISLFILVSLLSAFWVSIRVSAEFSKQHLIEETIELSQDMDDFEAYDEGIYFIHYAGTDNIEQGKIPEGFDASLPYNKEQVIDLVSDQGRYAYYDVSLGKGQGWLRGMIPVGQLSEDMRVFMQVMGLTFPILALTILGGGYWMLKRAFLPVKEMITAAQGITRDKDYSKRLPSQLKDVELKELADTLNQTFASVEDSFEREKQFNNDISHELRTPLSVILAESQYGQTYVADLAEAREGYATISRQAMRMKGLLEQILELARAENLHHLSLAPVDLTELVEEILPDYRDRLAEGGLVLKTDLSSPAFLAGDHLLLGRILDNLLSNAIKFAKTEVGVAIEGDAGQVRLTVWDDGIGIAADQQDKIWNRFYQVNQARTKSDDSSSGLGLSLVKQLVDLHEGKIELVSDSHQGARFILTFPILDKKKT